MHDDDPRWLSRFIGVEGEEAVEVEHDQSALVVVDQASIMSGEVRQRRG
jgi:hypothetical protein